MKKKIILQNGFLYIEEKNKQISIKKASIKVFYLLKPFLYSCKSDGKEETLIFTFEDNHKWIPNKFKNLELLLKIIPIIRKNPYMSDNRYQIFLRNIKQFYEKNSKFNLTHFQNVQELENAIYALENINE